MPRLAAVSPYAQLWLLLQLPSLLLLAVWGTERWWPARLAALGLLVWLLSQAASVLTGGLPSEAPMVPGLIETALLCAVLLRRPVRRFSIGSFVGAVPLFLLGDPLPAVVLLGRGSLEHAPTGLWGGLGLLLGARFLTQHAWLQVAELVGGLGFGMDPTTVLASLFVGLIAATGWVLLLKTSSHA